MTIEISDPTYHSLRRGEEGCYDSVQQAFDGNIPQAAAIGGVSRDADYLQYVQERIDAGLADLAVGRVRPAADVLAEMQALRYR